MIFWSPTRVECAETGSAPGGHRAAGKISAGLVRRSMGRAVLFDLDGTLTESGEGITRSVRYALEKMGRPEPDLHKLRVFIGPPLLEQFMEYAGMDEAEAKRAVEYYRERYIPIGIFENQPYPGIPEMLQTLMDNGFLLAVASSKTEVSVARVLEHYGLSGYFAAAVGSEPEGARSRKAEVIEEALRRLSMEKDREHVIMVGDKEHDVFGAREAGIRCVAVGYGYGTPEELEAADPFRIVKTVEDLTHFLLSETF